LLGPFFTRFGALLLLPEGRFSFAIPFGMVTFLKFCKFRERAPLLFVKCGGIGFVRPCVPSNTLELFKKSSFFFCYVSSDLLKKSIALEIKREFHAPG